METMVVDAPTAVYVTDARIQRTAKALSHVLLVMAWLLPAAGLWTLWNSSPADLLRNAGVVGEALRQVQQQPLAGLRLWAFALCTMVPVMLVSAALIQLRRTFVAFTRGAYFSVQAIAGLRQFALFIGTACLIEILLTPLRTVLLTWLNGEGQRQVVLALSSSQVMALVTALCVWVVTWVIGRAALLQEENKQFV
jgi:hypothetical protein